MKFSTSKLYDVFISYRKEGGFEAANLLYERLTQNGYKVFLDYEGLRSGKFNEQLYRQIDNCKDVIIILSKDSLDRCKNEGDWVRLEIARALTQKKNIVPVMLRGFSWPESLPEDIDELKLHQGVEASQELFDAFLLKLQKLLHSKPTSRFKLFIKKYTLFVFIPFLLVSGGIASFFYYKNHQEQKQYELICNEIVGLSSLDFIKMDKAMSSIKEVYKEWMKFYTKKMSEIDYINLVQHEKSQVDTSCSGFQLNPYKEELLVKHGIKIEDVKVLFSLHENKDALKYFDKMVYWAKMPESALINEIDDALNYYTELQLEMMRMDFYPYLELIQTMPATAKDIFLKARAEMVNFPDVSLDRKEKELDALLEQSSNKCKEFLMDYSTLLGNENIHVDETKNILKQIKQAASDRASQDLKEQRDSLNIKKNNIDERKDEINEKKERVLQTYEKLLQKCSFDPNEDQWMMWGKILRLAQLGQDALTREKEQDNEYQKQIINAGKNARYIEHTTTAVPALRIFTDVQNMLDTYLKYNESKDPNAAEYVAAAKKYYKVLCAKRIDPVGILMVGTKDNEPHPVLKTGDIIIERKGHSIYLVDEYQKLKDNPEPNVVKFIRFSANGEMNILSEKIESKVIVGLINLREKQ
jgi:hypothetical protein